MLKIDIMRLLESRRMINLQEVVKFFHEKEILVLQALCDLMSEQMIEIVGCGTCCVYYGLRPNYKYRSAYNQYN